MSSPSEPAPFVEWRAVPRPAPFWRAFSLIVYGVCVTALFALPALLAFASYHQLAALERPALLELGLAIVCGSLSVLGVYPFVWWARDTLWRRALRPLAGRCLFCGAPKSHEGGACGPCEAIVPDAHGLFYFDEGVSWPSVLALTGLVAGALVILVHYVREPDFAGALWFVPLVFAGLFLLGSIVDGPRWAQHIVRNPQTSLRGDAPGTNGWFSTSVRELPTGGLRLTTTAHTWGTLTASNDALADASLNSLARVLGGAIDRGTLRLGVRTELSWQTAPSPSEPATVAYRAAPAPARDETRVVGAYLDELAHLLDGALVTGHADARTDGDTFVELRELADAVLAGLPARAAVLAASPAPPPDAAPVSWGTRLVVTRLRAHGYT